MIDLIVAFVIDLLIGDPQGFPHPVRAYGKLIAREESFIRRLTARDKGLYVGGFFIVLVNIVVSFAVPFILLRSIKGYFVVYHIVNVYLLYTCIAARCLRDEGIKIYKALGIGIEEARYRLSFIVGRDTKALNENEIIRATVETVAENTSDGVIAPLLFAMIGGAPLVMLYKMVNTMDSMLGYLNPKYRCIGFFPAKTDDVLNYIPARLTGILMNASCINRFDVLGGFRIMVRDHKNHKSPNCAYPEGAVAGLLSVQLGGNNSYFGEIMAKPKIGDSVRKLNKEDIKKTIEIMFRAEILLMLLYALIEVLLRVCL